jgi:hypothetical protein
MGPAAWTWKARRSVPGYYKRLRPVESSHKGPGDWPKMTVDRTVVGPYSLTHEDDANKLPRDGLLLEDDPGPRRDEPREPGAGRHRARPDAGEERSPGGEVSASVETARAAARKARLAENAAREAHQGPRGGTDVTYQAMMDAGYARYVADKVFDAADRGASVGVAS